MYTSYMGSKSNSIRLATSLAQVKRSVPCLHCFGACRSPHFRPFRSAGASAVLPSYMDVEGAEQVNAVPVQIDQKIPWLWDTAAGRHIIGRQALSSEMKSCLRKSVSQVAFATGGGSQPAQESLGFAGSKILEGEEVYVLKECPPAQSIGKTVVDKGYLFVWDPSESVPYLVAPQDIKTCRLDRGS